MQTSIKPEATFKSLVRLFLVLNACPVSLWLIVLIELPKIVYVVVSSLQLHPAFTKYEQFEYLPQFS